MFQQIVKMNKIYYIYRIRNKINNKTYIGRSFHGIKLGDKNYFGSGLAIKKAVKTHGKENFEKTIIVDGINSFSEICRIEENIIKIYKKHNMAEYNLTTAGCGNPPEILNFLGRKHTEEYKKSMSQKISGMKRKPHTEEYKKRLSERMKKESVFLTKYQAVKGTKWYTNGVKDIMVPPDKQPPEGYVRGRSKTRGRPTWNSGTAKPRKRVYVRKTNYTEEEVKNRIWLRGITAWNKNLTKDDPRVLQGIEKSKRTKKEKGIGIGDSNPNAKKFKLISPSKEEFIVIGRLKAFCKEHKLSYSYICRHINKGVIKQSKYNKLSKYTDSLNTIGWSCQEIKDKL